MGDVGLIIVVTMTTLKDVDLKTTFATWGELTQWFVTSVRPDEYTRITIAIKRQK